jgi:hypothetical protein
MLYNPKPGYRNLPLNGNNPTPPTLAEMIAAAINRIGSGVISVFGRSGVVTAASGDYTAAQITNVPAGGITAVEVQAAINQLDTNSQTKRVVITASQTAVIDEAYTLIASATFTDPVPVNGKGFNVLIVNGTATIGGTPYSTAGLTVWRIYQGGVWANYLTTGGGGGSSVSGDLFNYYNFI